MTRTISYVAAISLALMSLARATQGSSAEISLPNSGTASAVGAAGKLDEGPVDQETDRTAGSPIRPLAEMDLIVALALDPLFGPKPRPVEPVSRPRARPFAATDPIVAQPTDPSFGPKARSREASVRPLVRPADLMLPDPPPTLAGASDLLCIAVAIYHEARNQPLDGQLAVASVILNRTEAPERWGDTPCAVLTPSQFSFLTDETGFPPIEESEAWAIAVEMAREALERGPTSVVGRADHYHTPAVSPGWDDDMVRVIQIDDHIFYNDPMTRG